MHLKLLILLCSLAFIYSCKENDNKLTTPIEMKTSNPSTNSTSFVAEYAKINGLEMYYEIHGSGSPLVLIHGGGSTINSTFGRIIPTLAKHHKIIAMELQAHGHTSDRDAPESFEQDAKDVAALLQHLHIPSADVLGFSNGGNTAMMLAIRHPEMVNKLIVAASIYKREGMPSAFWDGMEHAKFSDMPQGLKDEFLIAKNDTSALLNMFHRDVERMRTFKDWDEKEVSSIQCPTLLIVGDRDVVTPEHAVAMSRLIVNSRLAILPGTHGAFLGEITTLENGVWKQDFAVALLEQFLDGQH